MAMTKSYLGAVVVTTTICHKGLPNEETSTLCSTSYFRALVKLEYPICGSLRKEEMVLNESVAHGVGGEGNFTVI